MHSDKVKTERIFDKSLTDKYVCCSIVLLVDEL